MSIQLFLYLSQLEEVARHYSEEDYMDNDEGLAYENEIDRMIENAIEEFDN